jgi:hypothetical protein
MNVPFQEHFAPPLKPTLPQHPRRNLRQLILNKILLRDLLRVLSLLLLDLCRLGKPSILRKRPFRQLEILLHDQCQRGHKPEKDAETTEDGRVVFLDFFDFGPVVLDGVEGIPHFWGGRHDGTVKMVWGGGGGGGGGGLTETLRYGGLRLSGISI